MECCLILFLLRLLNGLLRIHTHLNNHLSIQHSFRSGSGTRPSEWLYSDWQFVWCSRQFINYIKIFKEVIPLILRQCFLFVNLVAIVVGCLLYIPNFYSLILSRLVQGICVGLFSALTSMVIK